MKNNDKNKIKKQLVSGGIYIALAAAVVTVTLNGVNKIIGENSEYDLPDVNDVRLPNMNLENSELSDKTPEFSNTFDANLFFGNDTKDKNTANDKSEDKSVSGVEKGVNAETQENKTDTDDKNNTENHNAENTPEMQGSESENTASADTEGIEYPTEPELMTYGFYAKPADGYIDREFSMDELLYSATMGDYRTHNGVDITGEPGSAVRAISAGTVEDVYYDNFYGYTVVINHADGIVAYYMNLSESIPQSITKGASVTTGQTIGGIGNSAVIECADMSHLHLSVMKDGIFVDPGEFLRS